MANSSRRPSLRIETLETRTLFAADLGMTTDLAAPAAAPFATQGAEESLANPVADLLASSGDSSLDRGWASLSRFMGDWDCDGIGITIRPINDGPINTVIGDWDGDGVDQIGLVKQAAETSVDRPALVDRAFGSSESTSRFDESRVDGVDFILWAHRGEPSSRYFILPTGELFR